MVYFKLLIIYLLISTPLMAKISLSDMKNKYSNIPSIEASETLVQHFNIGFSNTTGNTNNLDINAKYNFSSTFASSKKKALKVAFDTSLFYTKTDSKKSNEEYLVNLGLEQDLGSQWLSYFLLNWLRNPEFKNYDHKLSLGAGLGKDIFFDGTQSITIKLGTSYNLEDYANVQKSTKFNSLNEYIKYNNQLNKISKLYLQIGVLQNLENFSNAYEALVLLGVTFTVGEKINLILEQEIAYDNLPPMGFKKTDTKSIVRLGYKF